MMRAGDFIIRQSKLVLENKQHAILYAVILSLLSFASWLSVALVALVTLRRGAKSGFEVMLPALVVHSVPLMMVMSPANALINSLIAFLPCYIAAFTLRKTTRWQAVFGVFLTQALICFLLIQILAPDFIATQFNSFKNELAQYPEYKELIDSSIEGLNSLVLAQLLFGIRILVIIVSSIMSLMFARSIQAKLFLPGGFKSELIEFRSGRLSFLILTAISIASYYEIPCAINLLPLIFSYFLASGFSLACFIFARKKQVRVFIVLFLLIVLNPTFVLFSYIVFGSLDSLFNFRLYLPARVREST